MVPKIMFIVCVCTFLSIRYLPPSIAQTNWIRIGYYRPSNEFPISDVNFGLFTHIICAYVGVNSTSYQLSLSPADEDNFSTFIRTVKRKNSSVTTLLSIGGENGNYATFSSMGLDFGWQYPNTSTDMFNVGVLFQEWRAEIDLEAKSSNYSKLILTAKVKYTTLSAGQSYPVQVIQQNLNWVHVVSSNYTQPLSSNFTGAHAALLDPSSYTNTDYGISDWINLGGLSANKLVLALPLYGFAWTLENPMNNSMGAAAKGPAITETGFLTYKEIKNYTKRSGPDHHLVYNSSYVVNYWTDGTTWIGFDDVDAVRSKVVYAQEKKLLGYYVWEVSYDDNWVLSKAAAEVHINNSSGQEDYKKGENKRSLLAILLPTTAAVILLVGIFAIFFCRKLILKGTVDSAEQPKDRENTGVAGGDFNSNIPDLVEYTLADIEAATNGFSIKRKLGQGGYGPVYKGILPNGQEIAVKKLAQSSSQGYEEFKNEVTLTARLQHVNLVRVLGFCIDKEEKILVYEYMQNKSLDYYLFDPIRLYILDWEKRAQIIEGITQGLVYLQEYSRLTVIHRDIKLSNVLLDGDMKAKISDFGMARIFTKDDPEVNTKRIAGTIGYVPPEYIRRGIYSTKSDVYSFGVLLLQVISGKKISLLYGPNESLTLADYAYELWINGKAMEFMDKSLDDTSSSCKLIRCLHIALLCVQENPIDRPSMLEIFTMLKTETIDMMIPKKPAFSKRDEQNKPIVQFEGCSASTSSKNDVTITNLAAR
ncbi:cysteine-rich receptor-like protein kinase 19 isoform X2 [Mangifera indica]|uniref:cysteine-rich receptor-like protein kinase 19 isoform X2 n=1 Tax=Mangifera indica TaxID=29780 RepID=UPI001CFA6804|nr:cysteine-rich receptor-like protein kinase 19 isoform X2 [Mangifera indica]